MAIQTGRFFVTSVLIVGTAAFVACTSKTDKRSAQVREGNRQIQLAQTLSMALNTRYKLNLDAPTRYDWSRLGSADRQVVREQLAAFAASVTRTFAIDAKKGLYITKKEVLQLRLENAMTLQKSLDAYENSAVARINAKSRLIWKKPKSA